MDNVTRFYIAEYEEAHRLATSGKIDEALDLCFSLRLRPDLSLYLRATLNVLLGTIAKVDNRRYLEEAMKLIKDIREENGRDQAFPELDELEREAIEGLKGLEDEVEAHDGEAHLAVIEGMYQEEGHHDLPVAASFESRETERSFSSTLPESQPSSLPNESFDQPFDRTPHYLSSSPPPS